MSNIKGYAKTVAIVTTCGDDWGGSEELWAQGACFLHGAGSNVMVFKSNLPGTHPRYVDLHDRGIVLKDILPKRSWLPRLVSRLFYRLANGNQRDNLPGFVQTITVKRFARQLARCKPDLVIISQGINFDGLGYAYACLRQQVPYAVIAQKAVDFYWPLASDRPLMREILRHAYRCYFVSKHNQQLTEEQFGLRLPNSRIIYNPVKITDVVPFPCMDDGVRICCIGRLFVLDKGQDMLLRILSKPEWKERPIWVDFIGKGVDEVALKEMAALLGVTNIGFVGFHTDIAETWKSYHALVLPSRSEGLPLTIVEAMKAGRPIITTAVGGNIELLAEGKTGFIAEANEVSLASALSRAWDMRHRWKEMGDDAAQQITKRIPRDPTKDFINDLMNA